MPLRPGSTRVVKRASDLIVTAPSLIARQLAGTLGLKVETMPIETPPFSAYMAWHPRHAGDQAHEWLRGEISALVGGMGDGTKVET